jgi:hypothetical protein
MVSNEINRRRNFSDLESNQTTSVYIAWNILSGSLSPKIHMDSLAFCNWEHSPAEAVLYSLIHIGVMIFLEACNVSVSL